MTRQLISTNKQPLLHSSHAKRPPQNGFVQVGLPDIWVLASTHGDSRVPDTFQLVALVALSVCVRGTHLALEKQA